MLDARFAPSCHLPVCAALIAATSLLACADEGAGDAETPTETADAGSADAPSSVTDAEGTSTPGYYEHVKPIIDANCATCHHDDGIAPFSLTSYDEVAPIADLIAHQVENRIMPPWAALPGVREYKFDRSLTREEQRAIVFWAEDGAPAGDPASEGPSLDPEIGQEIESNTTLEMQTAYAPQLAPDDYRCFVLDWPYEDARFLTGYDFVAGEPSIVHHAIAYLVGPGSASLPEEMDDAEEGPGYTCFGGPSRVGSELFPANFLAIWAPGVSGTKFPAGTGIRIAPGSKIVLQIHYNVADSAAVEDQSRFDFEVTDEVEEEGTYLLFTDTDWLTNSRSMRIPAGEPRAIHSYTGALSDLQYLPFFNPGQSFANGARLHSVVPHMHKLGREIALTLKSGERGEIPLIDIDRWDFDWQQEYVFADPELLGPTDEVKITCAWDNSPAAQPVINGERRDPDDVYFGEGTFDEMCLAFFYAVPQ